ncbi:hypothetical protein L9F63_021388, partial [Diploptera punctata]
TSSSSVNISKVKWLLFLERNDLLNEYFTGIDIPFDCEFLVAQPADTHVVLTEVYRVGPTLPLHSYQFGNWSHEGGLTWTENEFYERRNSLYGLVIKTGYKN